MNPIDSTYKILYNKANDSLLADELVIWAIDMLEKGFDSEHLRILAGTEKPYNYFYLNDLSEKVFNELKIERGNKEKITDEYIYYLVNEALASRKDLTTCLTELRDICRLEYYDSKLVGFYLLSYAWEDLQSSEVQFYWPGATTNNILAIITDYFKEWKLKYQKNGH